MNQPNFEVIDRFGERVIRRLPPWSDFDMNTFLDGDISDESCAFCGEPLDFRIGLCVFDEWDDSWPESCAFAVHEQCFRKDCLEGSMRHIIWDECVIYRFPLTYSAGTRQPLEQIYVRYATFKSTFTRYNREETIVALRQLTAIRDPDGSILYRESLSSKPGCRVLGRDTADEFERGLLKHLGW